MTEAPIMEGHEENKGVWRARCRLCPWVSEEMSVEPAAFVSYQGHYASTHMQSSYPTNPTLAPQPGEGSESGE